MALKGGAPSSCGWCDGWLPLPLSSHASCIGRVVRPLTAPLGQRETPWDILSQKTSGALLVHKG